jgi:cell division protein ZipA
VEPRIGEEAQTSPADVELVSSDSAPTPKAPPPPPDRIIALRLMPRRDELSAGRTIAALQGAKLEHGRYSIFHRPLPPPNTLEPAFSVASLTEPGSFDLENLAGGAIAGLSFFVVLPGAGDPVARFDAMVETARALAVELDCELLDERGSSWSVQRERYIREEIIEYRHQMERR